MLEDISFNEELDNDPIVVGLKSILNQATDVPKATIEIPSTSDLDAELQELINTPPRSSKRLKKMCVVEIFSSLI